MAEYVEKWGDSIDSAVELALKDLKITRDEALITVLEQPSSGFLGLFGRKLAKVRVEKKPQEEKKPSSEPKRDAAEAEKSESADAGRNARRNSAGRARKETAAKPEKQEKPERQEYTADFERFSDSARAPEQENAAQSGEVLPAHAREGKEGGKKKHKSSQMHTKFTITAEDTDAVSADDSPGVGFIREIAENMGLNIEVKGYIKDDTLYVSLEGRDVGSMIGKRGQTLDAVQYLTSIVQNRNCDSHLRVIINAEKYREKREKTLQLLAKRLADKCIKSGKSVRLEPMNPYERKVIHSTLQSNPKVTTRSEGVEPNRRVVIELKR